LILKVKKDNAAIVSSSMFPNWDFCFNYEKHYLGSIWVCWNREDFKVFVHNKSDQSITCLVHSVKEKSSWYHTFVYGANKPIDGRLLWQNLLSMKMGVVDDPWILCSDFDSVRFLEEKWGSNSLNSYEIEFNDCLNSLEVMDLNFGGCFSL
jgi:hypothetical protein